MHNTIFFEHHRKTLCLLCLRFFVLFHTKIQKKHKMLSPSLARVLGQLTKKRYLKKYMLWKH